jgi:tricorn protease
MGLTWSHDSKWLAYTKTGTNNFRQIKVWSSKNDSIRALTNSFADSFSPAWDRDGHHLYFLASTNLALGSGWANTSAITSDPSYAAYIINLKKDDTSPFKPQSDEEKVSEEKKPEAEAKKPAKVKTPEKKTEKDTTKTASKEPMDVVIDFSNIERRTIAMPLPRGNYRLIVSGPSGTAFFGEQKEGVTGLVHRNIPWKNEKQGCEWRQSGSVSSTETRCWQIGSDWKIMNTSSARK